MSADDRIGGLALLDPLAKGEDLAAISTATRISAHHVVLGRLLERLTLAALRERDLRRGAEAKTSVASDRRQTHLYAALPPEQWPLCEVSERRGEERTDMPGTANMRYESRGS